MNKSEGPEGDFREKVANWIKKKINCIKKANQRQFSAISYIEYCILYFFPSTIYVNLKCCSLFIKESSGSSPKAAKRFLFGFPPPPPRRLGTPAEAPSIIRLRHGNRLNSKPIRSSHWSPFRPTKTLSLIIAEIHPPKYSIIIWIIILKRKFPLV